MPTAHLASFYVAMIGSAVRLPSDTHLHDSLKHYKVPKVERFVCRLKFCMSGCQTIYGWTQRLLAIGHYQRMQTKIIMNNIFMTRQRRQGEEKVE